MDLLTKTVANHLQIWFKTVDRFHMCRKVLHHIALEVVW